MGFFFLFKQIVLAKCLNKFVGEIFLFLFDFKVFSFILQKEQTTSDRSAGNSPYIDDLYLDDQEALEGSGRGGGEVRDDLEASGSGLGPDDEDGDDGGHGIISIFIDLDKFRNVWILSTNFSRIFMVSEILK